MRIHSRASIAALLLLASVLPAQAQTAADLSGHWQGAVQVHGTEMPFEIDLAKRPDGQLDGTLSLAAQKIAFLPLTKVTLDGRSVYFHARSDQPFTAALSDDRQSMAGEFLIDGNSLQFALTRSGDAKPAPSATSARIAKELEGTWTATVAAQGVERHLVMTLENHADGTATGHVVNEDEGGLLLPVSIAQQGRHVTIETLPVASTFAATLNDDATELAGTITQGGASALVTFRRAK